MKKHATKNVEVLIDLLGYGIVELSVAYSLNFNDVLPCTYSIECHTEPVDSARHTWLYSRDFKMIFSKIEPSVGYTVCFNEEKSNKNIYYQTMLNVVSDYILLKENLC